MSENTTNQSNDQEIDLGLLIQKVNGFIGNIYFNIFRFILFLKKNLLILFLIIIA